MNENKTTTILQRVPKILAVTAASYGLAQGQAQAQAAHGRGRNEHPRANGRTAQGKPH